MPPPRGIHWVLVLVPLSIAAARAQGVPSATSEPRAVEVDVHDTDAGQGLSAEDAQRLGLSPDAGDTTLVPPSLTDAALAAAPGLRFTPATLGGAPPRT